MSETATAKSAEQLQARREKAANLLAAGAVTFGEDEFAEVKAEVAGSQEMPYVVTVQEGEWTCTCPDPFQPCKHIIAVQMALERDQRDEANMEQVQPGSALAKPLPYAGAQEWQLMREQVRVVLNSHLLPKHIKTTDQALTIALKGRELGVPMMESFAKIFVIQGTPAMHTELMMALIGRSGKVAWKVVESTDKKATVHMERLDGTAEFDATFSMADAQRAGLLRNPAWKQYPQMMLLWRAFTWAARVVAADIIGGVSYSPEELGAGVTVSPQGDVDFTMPDEDEVQDAEFEPVDQDDEAGEAGEWDGPSEKGTAAPLMDQDTPPEALGFEPPVCEYCGGTAVLRDSAVLYNGKSYGLAWICENYPECDAYVGAREDGNKPLGRLANAELRGWKQKAHAAFDPLWKDGPLSRTEAYNWMADILGLTKEQAHIGEFDVGMCKGLVAAVEARKASEDGQPEPEAEPEPDPEEGETPDPSMLEDMTPRNDHDLNVCLKALGIPQPWKPLKRAAMTLLYTTVPTREDVTPEMWTAIWLKVLDWSTSGKIADVLAEHKQREEER